MKKEIEEKFTKYEIARILGARALQIAMNAPILVKISEEKLKEIRYDPIEIAKIELEEDVLPISVKRPFPKKIESKLEIERKKIEKEEKIEEKINIEKIEEKEEEEIKEEGEIMELASDTEETSEETSIEEEGM
ncbi:MAG: DNA-directed RNA polymerase subunit K [Candidatus Pacearchaeota archaeon]